MIIWVNGAFGSGKTQTANELLRRIPDSYLYDPEHAGYFIRKNIPKQMSKNDFQDFMVWREFNYSILKTINDEFKGTIIVPMTIVNPQYFHEIVGRLIDDGVKVHHFTLCASKETILKRLKSRGEGKNSWAAKQIDRCLAGLSHEAFQTYIETDHLSIDNIVEEIASATNIQLSPDSRNKMRKRIDRLITKLKHFHFWW